MDWDHLIGCKPDLSGTPTFLTHICSLHLMQPQHNISFDINYCEYYQIYQCNIPNFVRLIELVLQAQVQKVPQPLGRVDM